MPSDTIGDPLDLPRPVSLFLMSAYYILLTFGCLACTITAACLLWHRLGIGRRIARLFAPVRGVDADERRCQDEESGEGSLDESYVESDDDEYMRWPC